MTTVCLKCEPKQHHTPPFLRLRSIHDRDLDNVVTWVGRVCKPKETVHLTFAEGVQAADILLVQTAINKGLEDSLVKANTFVRASRLWVERALGNMHRWWHMPIPMPGHDAGPVIIAAAGPSLDHNLRDVPPGVPLWCVNTSYRSLCRAGITPDLVVMIEAVDVSSHLDGLPVPNTALDRTVHPILWERTNPIMSFSPPAISGWVGPMVDVGYCAAHAAYSLAVLMGHDPIILIGQDLAFDDEGMAYSASSLYADQRLAQLQDDTLTVDVAAARQQIPGAHLQSKHPRHRVMSWDRDRLVDTTKEWDIFRRWYERREEPVRRINATEGGVHIQDWEHIPLRELNLNPKPFRPELHPCDYGPMSEELAKLRRRARRVLRLRRVDQIEQEMWSQPLLEKLALPALLKGTNVRLAVREAAVELMRLLTEVGT